MSKPLTEVRDDLRQKTLHSRSLEAIIMTERFERLWMESTVSQRETVMAFIEFGFKSRVSEWMKNHPSLELGERPISYLKERGRLLGIRNYSRLQKAELISQIHKKEQDYEKDKG